MKPEPPTTHPTRRSFIKTAGGITAASALSGVSLPHVFAGESNTMQLAIVGCGGRGTGAAVQGLEVKSIPTGLVAMADVFAHKLNLSHRALDKSYPETPISLMFRKNENFSVSTLIRRP